jgi:vitamin B12 transporter
MDAVYGAFSGSLTYFKTDFENLISYSYIPEEDLTRYENVEGARISGFEGTFDFDFGAHFYWTWELAPYASFTCLTERDDENTGEDLQYTPEWTASYGIRFANPELGFASRLNVSHTGEQDIIDYEGTGENTFDAVTVADLTISKTLFAFQETGRVVLNTEIRNLFNENYEFVQGYPAPGRNFFVGVKYVY